MEYPEEVLKHIKFLSEYKEDDGLTQFNILQLYPLGLCYPDGYYDSRWFNLVAYNYLTGKMKNYGKHDGLKFDARNMPTVDIVRIFADGSTLIRFNEMCNIENWQATEIFKANK